PGAWATGPSTTRGWSRRSWPARPTAPSCAWSPSPRPMRRRRRWPRGCASWRGPTRSSPSRRATGSRPGRWTRPAATCASWPRRGKSSLLLQLARHLMAEGAAGRRARALVLVDPRRDLARAALGLVPPARRGGVVALDLADAERPFGLNLLDAGLGWDRDQA